MYLNMEDLKIYGVSIGAVLLTSVNAINPYLQTIVLLTSIVYTVSKTYKNFKENGKS